MVKIRRLAIAITLMAGGVAIVGCSGTPTPTPTVTVTQTVTVTVTATPPTPTPTIKQTYAIGEIATIGGLRVTVKSWKANSAPNAPAPPSGDVQWASIQIEVCNDSAGNGTLTSSPWRLLAGSSRYEPSSIGYRQFPEPDLTFSEEPLNQGDCVSGWITFPGPKSSEPTGASYLAYTGNTISWTF